MISNAHPVFAYFWPGTGPMTGNAAPGPLALYAFRQQSPILHSSESTVLAMAVGSKEQVERLSLMLLAQSEKCRGLGSEPPGWMQIHDYIGQKQTRIASR